MTTTPTQKAATTPTNKATTPTRKPATMRYFWHELIRVVGNWRGLALSVLFPIFMYAIVVSTLPDPSLSIGRANVNFSIMTSMAIYGAITVAAIQAASIAADRQSGWLRILALTPLSPRTYLVIRSVVIGLFSLVPVFVLMAVGWIAGARADGWVWIVTVVMTLIPVLIFALIGLGLGLIFDATMIMRLLGLLTVVCAFMGNIFNPLSGTMLTISKFTPLFGGAMLMRYPIVGNENVLAGAEVLPLWQPLLNTAVWLGIVVGFAALAYRRGLQR